MPILPLYSVPACPKCNRIRSKKGAKLSAENDRFAMRWGECGRRRIA